MAGSWPSEALKQRFEQGIGGVGGAQHMGMPDEYTFHFADTRAYPEADSDGRSWDPRGTDEPEGPEPPETKSVICGKKVLQTATDQTALGEFLPIVIRLTFLPDAWAEVSEFVAVDIDGIRYVRGKMLPTSALFDTRIVRVDVRHHDHPGANS